MSGPRLSSPALDRMRTLALLEWLNALVIFPVAAWVWHMPVTGANLTGFALLALILVEGGAYWWLKYRHLRMGRQLPAGLTVFRYLRTANVALLAAGAAVIGAGFAIGGPWTHVWPGAGLWAFALLEHINYFHIQLSHDTRADITRLLRTRRLHRSHLARDLERLSTTRAPDAASLPGR
ncbi:hypothetical protein GCM10009799_40910 [Nocardiopsis rhodophaea]|uniref:Uncharacterized protein n=1 Tax=Nocardiopsis rhodophaea TaxID=280238 RepID=A0ABP5EXQ7_9ACTN